MVHTRVLHEFNIVLNVEIYFNIIIYLHWKLLMAHGCCNSNRLDTQ